MPRKYQDGEIVLSFGGTKCRVVSATKSPNFDKWRYELISLASGDTVIANESDLTRARTVSL